MTDTAAHYGVTKSAVHLYVRRGLVRSRWCGSALEVAVEDVERLRRSGLLIGYAERRRRREEIKQAITI